MLDHPFLVSLAEAALVVLPLALSLSVQQYAQARVAYALGDDTAKRAGRLTLDPLVHIDPIGTLLLPFALVMLQGQSSMLPLFGWAKPAPIDPRNMTTRLSKRAATALMALAAPLANAVLALGSAIALVLAWRHPSTEVAPIASLASTWLSINVALTLFQMLPIGSLSGFRLLCCAVPREVAAVLERLNQTYGSFAMLALLLLGRDLLGPALRFVAGGLLTVVNRIL